MKAQETLLDFLVEHYSEETFLKADGFDSACIGFDYKTHTIDILYKQVRQHTCS